jgi:hypothetical protein
MQGKPMEGLRKEVHCARRKRKRKGEEVLEERRRRSSRMKVVESKETRRGRM